MVRLRAQQCVAVLEEIAAPLKNDVLSNEWTPAGHRSSSHAWRPQAAPPDDGPRRLQRRVFPPHGATYLTYLCRAMLCPPSPRPLPPLLLSLQTLRMPPCSTRFISSLLLP